MTDFFSGPLLGFDIESTGVDNLNDRIVTFSIVYSQSAAHAPMVLEWLINPGVDIPEGASAVHGITTEHARDNGMNPKIALQEIADRLVPIIAAGTPLVAFNIPFDSTMLLEEFHRYGIRFPYTADQAFKNVIDPLVIDKEISKFRKGSRKLTDVAKHYGYDLTNAHESTADVLATLHIARALEGHFRPGTSLETLQDYQKSAKAEQSESLQKFFRKKNDDPTIVINGEWPYMTNSWPLELQA